MKNILPEDPEFIDQIVIEMDFDYRQKKNCAASNSTK